MKRRLRLREARMRRTDNYEQAFEKHHDLINNKPGGESPGCGGKSLTKPE